ncbi:MAG: adenosine deaminase [Clostridia bacterium]|nr:adenosine deaminase [Clostridia bacterium]
MKNLEKFALIDLHSHLDGAIMPEMIIELANKVGVKLPTYDPVELKEYVSADINCESLVEYLNCFEIPCSVMQTKENISDSVYYVLKDQDKRGLIYTELRFAPQKHIEGGLTMDEVIQAAIDGRNRAMAECDIKANIICCCMKGPGKDGLLPDFTEGNIATVKAARKFLGKGVCLVDIAGAENLCPIDEFEYIFDLCKELGMPFITHAGENTTADQVKKAIEYGAQRIGHGLQTIQDPEIMKFVAEKGTPLEMCPVSNLQTKSILDIKKYPIREFLDAGIRVTINTDNLNVSRTQLVNEYQLVFDNLDLDEKDAVQLLKNSIYACAISDEEKQQLVERLKKDPFYADMF